RMQIAPGQEFHANVQCVAVLAETEDAHNPWMIEPGGRLGFSVEPIVGFLIREGTGSDELDRARLIQTHVPRAVNNAHAPLAKPLEYLEPRQLHRVWRRREIGPRALQGDGVVAAILPLGRSRRRPRQLRPKPAELLSVLCESLLVLLK